MALPLRLSRRTPFHGLPKPQPARRAGNGQLHPWRWALAGALIGWSLIVVLHAPARWLAAVVARVTQDKVQLSAPEGTWWQGSAWLVLSGGHQSRDATTLPTRLHWRLQPRWLGADLQLESACCTATPLRAQLRWAASGTRLNFSDSTLQLPTSLLSGLGTPWNTLQLDGTLNATTSKVQLLLVQGRLDYTGTTTFTLQQASTRLSTISPIGSYRVHLRGGKPAGAGPSTPAELALETLPGSSLQLTGTGQWVGSRLRFTGEARTAPEHANALNNLLNIIGRRSGDRSLISLG